MQPQKQEHLLGLNCSSLVISFILKFRDQMSLQEQWFLKSFIFHSNSCSSYIIQAK